MNINHYVCMYIISLHVYTSTTATDDYIDIPEVYGCRVVTVTAVAFQGSGNEAMQILKSDEEAMHGECPLDIKVDLMVIRKYNLNSYVYTHIH